jgi:hypothetical protein
MGLQAAFIEKLAHHRREARLHAPAHRKEYSLIVGHHGLLFTHQVIQTALACITRVIGF